MTSNKVILRAVPVLMCVAWALLIIPHDPIHAANNCELCNDPWDCNSDCLCTNAEELVQQSPIVVYACVRKCTDGVMNVIKHTCNSTGNPNDNCKRPYQPAKCGYSRKVHKNNIVYGRKCTDDDWGNWVDCTNSSTTQVNASTCNY